MVGAASSCVLSRGGGSRGAIPHLVATNYQPRVTNQPLAIFHSSSEPSRSSAQGLPPRGRGRFGALPAGLAVVVAAGASSSSSLLDFFFAAAVPFFAVAPPGGPPNRPANGPPMTDRSNGRPAIAFKVARWRG